MKRVLLSKTRLSRETQRDLGRIRVVANEDKKWAAIEQNTARFARASEIERIARREVAV